VFLDESYYENYLGINTDMEEEAAQARLDHAENHINAGIAVDRIMSAGHAKLPRVHYQRVVDHIDHAVEIAGIDHVGLGSDFDGIPSVPAGLEDISKLQVITGELVRRGYDRESIEKILCRNVMRVF